MTPKKSLLRPEMFDVLTLDLMGWKVLNILSHPKNNALEKKIKINTSECEEEKGESKINHNLNESRINAQNPQVREPKYEAKSNPLQSKGKKAKPKKVKVLK